MTPQTEYRTSGDSIKMTGRVKDLRGRRFGRLLVISFSGHTAAGKAKWLCKCDCRKMHVVIGASLINGTSVSCGCYMVECAIARSFKHGQAKRGNKSATWKVWVDVVKRCTNPNFWAWEHYGGRGISIDPSWLDFSQFFADMGERPRGLTLDRLDNNRGYDPGNCAWVSRRRQAENRRVPKNNRSGCKGIAICKNCYHARITTGGKKISLGRFPLTEEGLQKAVALRRFAEDLYWGQTP